MQRQTAMSGGSVSTWVAMARPFRTVTLATTFIVEGALHAVTKLPRTSGAPSCALESGAACLCGAMPASAVEASPVSTGDRARESASQAGSSHGESFPAAPAATRATIASAVQTSENHGARRRLFTARATYLFGAVQGDDPGRHGPWRRTRVPPTLIGMSVCPSDLASTLVARRRAQAVRQRERAEAARARLRGVARTLRGEGALEAAGLVGCRAGGGLGERSHAPGGVRGAGPRVAHIAQRFEQEAGIPVDLLVLEELPERFRRRVLTDGGRLDEP